MVLSVVFKTAYQMLCSLPEIRILKKVVFCIFRTAVIKRLSPHFNRAQTYYILENKYRRKTVPFYGSRSRQYFAPKSCHLMMGMRLPGFKRFPKRFIFTTKYKICSFRCCSLAALRDWQVEPVKDQNLLLILPVFSEKLV